MKKELCWMIGGEAGYGIMSAGAMFSKCFSRIGYQIFANSEFPSLIRGGHNSFKVRISKEKIYSQTKFIDLLTCLNKETFDLHQKELNPDAWVIYDKDEFIVKHQQAIHVPMYKIAAEYGEKKLLNNTVAIGASLALIDYDFKDFENLLTDFFKGKKPEIIEKNIRAAKQGYDFVKNNYTHKIDFKVKKENKKRLVLGGNEAVFLGAVNAGCNFLSDYPMTPSTGVLHQFARYADKLNLTVVQTEDEISALNMAIGASFAGVRAMTATSGGGFSLMVEALGLAGMTETPVVILNAQRPGPATGLPTKTEQGDLRFMIHAAQGEFPRIIIAPGDAEESFYETEQAFNLADKYQIPVIILGDKYLQESYHTIDNLNLNFKINRGKLILDEKKLPALKLPTDRFSRYKLTADGVSPRTIPGMKNGIMNATSDEHNELGVLIDGGEMRNKMMEKRMNKLEAIKKELPLPKTYGKGEITLVCWGSNKGTCLEAIKLLKKEKIEAKLIHFVYMFPFKEEIKKLLKKEKKLILIETNQTAQLGSLIKENCLIDIKNKILKFDGEPFNPEEIAEQVKRFK
ncbi:MAG: 2-oxoacid:acceptor oxidoreductase subunit alpha [Candidatus Woesearchaeota archaeon]